jgi:hypothetical protein
MERAHGQLKRNTDFLYSFQHIIAHVFIIIKKFLQVNVNETKRMIKARHEKLQQRHAITKYNK